jgi:hypothetical protein
VSHCASYFKTFRYYETLCAPYTELRNLFQTSWDVAIQAYLPPKIVSHHCQISLCAAYLFFGISIFSVEGMKRLSRNIQYHTGCSEEVIWKWCSAVKYYFREESPSSFETYWDEERLNQIFCFHLIKRFFCSDLKEDWITGTYLVYDEEIRAFREQCSFLLNHLLNFRQLPSLEEDPNPYILKCMQDIQQDPFVLMVWRMESFANFTKIQTRQNPDTLTVIPSANEYIDALQSKKMLSLLSLLKNDIHSPSTFLNIYKKCSDQKKEQVQFHLEMAVENGFLFQKPYGKKQNIYGLTDVGMKVLEPFDAFCLSF